MATSAARGFLVGDHSIRPRRPVRYLANKQATKSTKRKKKKPEWDSTVNDLNVHKATKEEQVKRHELHKSKNATKVHLQRQLKDRSQDSTIQTPDTAERRKLAIVQEVLYGHDKLQDVLSESDKAMSVVKDLFGDDPKKFMGFPNITAAPSNVLHGKENRFAVGPVAEPPETPTHLSLLSDSVMRTPALNDLSDDNKEDDELSPGTPNGHETKHSSSSFQPKLDLQRFQQYVAQEQSRYVENQSQHLLNGHGSDHVVIHGLGSDHVAPDGRVTGHVAPHVTMDSGPDMRPDRPDVYPKASQPYVHPQAAVPSTAGAIISDESSGTFRSGRGPNHVAPHVIMDSGPDMPPDCPDVYPKASQPYVHPQAAVPSTAGIKISDESSGTFPSGRGPNHVAPHGNIVSGSGYASQPSSFLSQQSAEIIAGGGPNFVMPVSTGESTANSSIPTNARPSSRNAEGTHQGSSKTKRRTKTSDKPPSGSSSSGLRSLDDLKKMVEELENEIAAYECETGRQQTSVSTASASFSGYTASLITAVTKLMGYLKESEIQRKAEMVMREQILHGFEEQRVLVDALTNDILHTQEQNLALQHELLEYKRTTDEQLQYLKRELFAVLRSHEYQALSSSINTLYSLNPVALNQGTFDARHPTRDENHNLEYLPGAPVLKTQKGREQERFGKGARGDVIAEPSFIPLATSQGQGIAQYPNMDRKDVPPQVSQGNIQSMTSSAGTSREPAFIALDTSHRTDASLQQGAQAPNQPFGSSHSVQSDVRVSTGNQHVVAPVAMSDRQLPHNGHVPSGYLDSGSARVMNCGMRGHGQISPNILMYPPSQVPFTQAENKVMTSTSTTGVPSSNSSMSAGRKEAASLSSMVEHMAPSTAPPVRNEPAQLSSIVGNSASSTAPPVRNDPAHLSSIVGHLPTAGAPPVNEPASHSSMAGQPAASTSPSLYSAHQRLPGQSVRNLQTQLQPGQPVSRTMEPTPSVSLGIPAPAPGAPTTMSQTLPRAAPPEPKVGLGSVTRGETSHIFQHQQLPQQVQAQPSAKLDHASKSRGYVPVPKAVVSGALPAGHQLRERLQNMANRQKSLVVKHTDQDVGSVPSMPQNQGETKEVQQPRPTSPHVHFKDPPVAMNRHDSGKEQQKHSPPVSPIPYKNAAAPRSNAPPDKRVVVSLPNAWSDVSSTISL